MDVFNGYGVGRMRVWKEIQFLRERQGHGIASSFPFFATMSQTITSKCRHLAVDELDHQYSPLHQGNLSPRAQFEFLRAFDTVGMSLEMMETDQISSLDKTNST